MQTGHFSTREVARSSSRFVNTAHTTAANETEVALSVRAGRPGAGRLGRLGRDTATGNPRRRTRAHGAAPGRGTRGPLARPRSARRMDVGGRGRRGAPHRGRARRRPLRRPPHEPRAPAAPQGPGRAAARARSSAAPRHRPGGPARGELVGARPVGVGLRRPLSPEPRAARHDPAVPDRAPARGAARRPRGVVVGLLARGAAGRPAGLRAAALLPRVPGPRPVRHPGRARGGGVRRAHAPRLAPVGVSLCLARRRPPGRAVPSCRW